MKKVLIMEDELNIRSFVVINLKRGGYDVLEAANGSEALDKLQKNPDVGVAILDIMVPGDMDGFEVCKTLRSEGDNVPIIMITAREEETDMVFGLENGADDYVTKPFSRRALMARVKTNMRRSAAAPASESADSNCIRIRKLVIDLDRHSVSNGARVLELTQREYEIIKFMAQCPGKVVSRQDLMSQVWQYDYYGDLRTVDVAMRRLREKLEDNPAEPEYIITKRGAGYYIAE